MPDDQTPAGDESGRRGMAREDKIALTIVGAIAMMLTLAVLIGIRAVLTFFGGVYDGMADGVGLRAAFIASLGISFLFILVFAVFAGEGVVGELGIMLIGFFVMLAFFTISIAVVL